jgi:integrase
VRVVEKYTRGAFGTPKSDRSVRAVPMAPRLEAELRAHHARSVYNAEDDLVFCHPQTGYAYDASKLRTRFVAAFARGGVREITFHELRHTYDTQMAAVGAPLRAIQEWTGREDFKTTSIYAHYAPDPTKDAKWAEAAFGEGGHDAVAKSGR